MRALHPDLQAGRHAGQPTDQPTDRTWAWHGSLKACPQRHTPNPSDPQIAPLPSDYTFKYGYGDILIQTITYLFIHYITYLSKLRSLSFAFLLFFGGGGG